MKQFIYNRAEDVANHSGRAVFVYRDSFNQKLYLGFSVPIFGDYVYKFLPTA
jgi:hypothetical protein